MRSTLRFLPFSPLFPCAPLTAMGEIWIFPSSSGEVPSPLGILHGVDAISNTVCSVIDAADFVRNAHADEGFRDAADEAFSVLAEYIQARHFMVARVQRATVVRRATEVGFVQASRSGRPGVIHDPCGKRDRERWRPGESLAIFVSLSSLCRVHKIAREYLPPSATPGYFSARRTRQIHPNSQVRRAPRCRCHLRRRR